MPPPLTIPPSASTTTATKRAAGPASLPLHRDGHLWCAGGARARAGGAGPDAALPGGRAHGAGGRLRSRQVVTAIDGRQRLTAAPACASCPPICGPSPVRPTASQAGLHRLQGSSQGSIGSARWGNAVGGKSARGVPGQGVGWCGAAARCAPAPHARGVNGQSGWDAQENLAGGTGGKANQTTGCATGRGATPAAGGRPHRARRGTVAAAGERFVQAGSGAIEAGSMRAAAKPDSMKGRAMR